MGTCGPSTASAPPLATGPSRVVHVPPPRIPPAPVPPCPPASPPGGEQSPSHPQRLSVTHITAPAPSHTSNCVRAERRAAPCCHCHHQGHGHCPCGTDLLSQFPIWDRDTAPSCSCLCKLFGNLFSQIPSLSLHLLHWETRGRELSCSRAGKPQGRRAAPSFMGAERGSCSAWCQP